MLLREQWDNARNWLFGNWQHKWLYFATYMYTFTDTPSYRPVIDIFVAFQHRQLNSAREQVPTWIWWQNQPLQVKAECWVTQWTLIYSVTYMKSHNWIFTTESTHTVARACNWEDLLNRQVEWFVKITNWLRNMSINSSKQLLDSFSTHLRFTSLYTTHTHTLLTYDTRVTWIRDKKHNWFL